MRKAVSCFVCICLLAALAAPSLAAGVTVRTYTPFADVDFAAQVFMDAVTAWEGETGDMVEDYSGLTDEAWIAAMLDAAASGEADLLIVPVGTGLTKETAVTAAEIAAAAPELGARELPAMAEADGSVLLTPVRLDWEALYVNTDVLEAAGVAVPGTYEELVAACATLAAKGVTPIANALCEWSETALDCAALIGAPASEYGAESSLNGAQTVLSALTAVGAFGPDAWNAQDAACEAEFIEGRAAMRFDTAALVSLIPEGRQDSVTVVSVTGSDGQPRTQLPGTPSFGLTFTRACWQDDARREAALSLAKALLTGESAAALVCPAASKLGESVRQLTANATDCTGLLYDHNPEGFDAWADSVVATLMSIGQ